VRLPAFLTPAPVRDRTIDSRELPYVRSYLIMRTVAGLLGVLLPVLVVLFDGLLLGGHPVVRTSLSAYYYSGAREIFIGTLSAIGIFLITYKIGEVNLDNTLSMIAGGAVLVVALFPTDRSDSSAGLTLLQSQFGEASVGGVHIGFAGLFFVALGAISCLFGRREENRPPGKRFSPRFWRNYHWICAAIIGLALIWCVATRKADWAPSRKLYYGEVVALCAFGVSWFGKGWELEVLRRRR
jgi:hypothetical protein